MQPGEERHTLNLRAILASSRTPFSVASYERGAVLCRQGEPCDSLMYIEHGLVRLAVTTHRGREATCGLLATGAFLCEDSVADGHAVHGHTATATTPTDVIIVARSQMIRLLRTEPQLADRFIAHLLERRARLEADLADQLLHSSEQRLARALVLLAGCEGPQSSTRVLPPVSQGVLAEMVGTTRSRVNVFLAKFKKRGFIDLEDGVLRVHPRLLQFLHGGDRGFSRETLPAPFQPPAAKGPLRWTDAL